MLTEPFHYRDGALWCDNIELGTIADAVGTPAYLYSETRIRHNVARLKAAFEPLGATIHYSLKANANLELIHLLHSLGLGMDAVSAGEVYRAQHAGVPAAQIVFAGVGKTRTELTYALEVGVGWFNVESEQELQLLDSLAELHQQTPTVALRLNPGIHAQTHHHIATGHFGAKFGMDIDTVADVLAHREHYPHLAIQGIHIHIGSQLGRIQETLDAVRTAQSLARSYKDIRTLNIGGGFPVRYTNTDSYPDPAEFAAALAPLVKGWQLKIEPGRSIIADTGVLLVSVLYVKKQGDHHFVITDGSMTDLLRPALYDAVHPVVPLNEPTEPTQETIVAGPVCESADVLNRGADLPPLRSGDQLAVLMAGAYGMTMASNYNARTRPPEIMVDGDCWCIIRRRETWDDLLRLEETSDEGL